MAVSDPQPHQPEFWDKKGCAFCQAEQYHEAIAAFDRAIAINPSCCQAWNNQANALCGLKRYAEALAAYDRAVAIQPNYHQSWFNRGLLLMEMMAYGNALESYERAIDLHLDPRYLLAREEIWLKQKLTAVA